MKIKLFILCFSLLSLNSFGQRKKTVNKPKIATVLAKLDNVSVEILKNNLYVFNTKVGKDSKTDTIILKMNIQKSMPIDCKISVVNLKPNQFYIISWVENEITTTKLKTEEATTVFTEICDFSSKTKVFSNFQKTTKIKEIRFLDVNQTVSETIDKIRKEGNEFKIQPDGIVIQTNKKGEIRWIYNPKEKIYVLKQK